MISNNSLHVARTEMSALSPPLQSFVVPGNGMFSQDTYKPAFFPSMLLWPIWVKRKSKPNNGFDNAAPATEAENWPITSSRNRPLGKHLCWQSYSKLALCTRKIKQIQPNTTGYPTASQAIFSYCDVTANILGRSTLLTAAYNMSWGKREGALPFFMYCIVALFSTRTCAYD